MTLLPHKLFRSDTSLPLYAMLLNFKKEKSEEEPVGAASKAEIVAALELLRYDDPKALERRTREMTIKQLATILRMQAEEGDDLTMLNSLESLVLAGEIPDREFIERMRNLFPQAMDTLDISMRMKIAALEM